MTENEKYLEMPWRIEETIENLKLIKEHLSATVLKTNLDGKGKQDAKEVEFDFNRAIKALEKQIPKKPVIREADEETDDLDFCTQKGEVYLCPTCNDYIVCSDVKHCWNCGQKLDLG